MPCRHRPSRPITRDYIADKFIEFSSPSLPHTAARQTRFATLPCEAGARHRVDFGFVICEFPATLIEG